MEGILYGMLWYWGYLGSLGWEIDYSHFSIRNVFLEIYNITLIKITNFTNLVYFLCLVLLTLKT